MIGVIPAAGYATRLGALGCSKEVLCVGGVPLIELLVQRMEVASCSEIRIVTRPEKHDVRKYAEKRGLAVVLGYPRHLGASIAAGLADIPEDELVATGFPDSIWEPLDGFIQLREALDEELEVVLGLFDFDDPGRADVVLVDEHARVRNIFVKAEDPPTTVIWGCLVGRARALRGMGREAWPSDHLRPLLEQRSVGAVYLSDRYVDIGTPDALANLSTHGWILRGSRLRDRLVTDVVDPPPRPPPRG